MFKILLRYYYKTRFLTNFILSLIKLLLIKLKFHENFTNNSVKLKFMYKLFNSITLTKQYSKELTKIKF